MSERRQLDPVGEFTSSRIAAVPGPPARRPQRVDVSSIPAPADRGVGEADAAPAERKSLAPARKKAPESPRTSRAKSGTARLTMTMPADLIPQIRDRARSDGITQPELLLDALAATQEALPQAFAAEQAPPRDGLFVRRPSRENRAPVATLSLRILEENLAAIDDLAEKVAAPSRSALCAAALRLYLQG